MLNTSAVETLRFLQLYHLSNAFAVKADMADALHPVHLHASAVVCFCVEFAGECYLFNCLPSACYISPILPYQGYTTFYFVAMHSAPPGSRSVAAW
jgi:hypothetical protein